MSAVYKSLYPLYKMPILQPNTTRIGSGPGGFTDIYAVAGGDATFANLDVTGNLDVSGTITSAGSAVTFGGTTTVTRAAAGVDGYLKVLNNGGEGIGIRAYDPAGGQPNGTVALQTVINSTTNGTGGLVFDPSGNVSVPDQKTMAAAIFNLKGGTGLGGPNYGIQNVSPAGNQAIPNTAITANSIVNVTLQSASGIVFVPRVSLSPGVGFTIYNDDPIVAHTMSYNVVCLDASV